MWYKLGVYLHIPKTTLDYISASLGSGYDPVSRCKMEMLHYWITNCAGNANWSSLAAALHDMGKTGLARRISQKYGIHTACDV